MQELASMQLPPPPSAPPAPPLLQQPQLGPQMVDVIDMTPPPAAPGPLPPTADCSCPPDAGQAMVVSSPDKPKEKVRPNKPFYAHLPFSIWQ